MSNSGTVPPLREGVCPHESGCPGPFRGLDPQLDLLAG